MGMFKNTQKITKITFEPATTHNFCPLGQLFCDELAKDGSKPQLPHYTNHFRITFVPGEFICDYIDVEKWIKKEINDESLIIEDAVSNLYDYVMETYHPEYLLVETYVDDAMHGAVNVQRESI